MFAARKLYELISILARRHGLAQLDQPARWILDVVLERESRGMKTTARDLVEDTEFSRALVYRKLNDLKAQNWIAEEWVDYKLCYKVGPRSETYFSALEAELKTQYKF